nr:helicase [Streptomyces venezuelae]
MWIVNQKQRRERLTPQQLSQLADLGVHWAR